MSIELLRKSNGLRKEGTMKTIGEKIRDRRLDLGLKQQEVAQKANLSLRTLSKYETDIVKPRALNVRRLCTILGVSEAYLTNPEIDDPTYGLAEAPYVDAVREKYGAKGADEIQDLLTGVKSYMAGGDVPLEDKEKFFEAVMEAYVAAKSEAHNKFTPKKYRK